MSDVSKNLFEGMRIVARAEVDTAGYDKTYRGVVSNITDKGYDVAINGRIYPNTPSVWLGNINIGDVVYVLFPLNNPVNRVILGSIKNT